LAARALTTEAARAGLRFDYEGSVMSGTPVLRLARWALAGSGIFGFKGILNGTSNFILGRMEAGLDFAAALSEAQAAGYAEADPAADVEGHDVRLKVVILANELLGADLAPSQVDCSGITALTPADIATAVSNGQRWKLIGSASRQADGRVVARVGAECLPVTHPLTGVSGAVNAVTFTTQMLGDVTITGPGAGRIETAYALLSDIIALHRDRTAPMLQEAAE
jgi:homoserine dehydrogenase